MKVYKFLSDLSFYSLTFEKEGELDKFLHLYDNHFGKSVKSLWLPLRITIVEGKESFPASDFPHLTAGFPVMSRRAKEALYDLISPYVEFLPLQSSFGGEYYGINVLEEVDALDEEASELKRFPNGRVMVIRKYVFKPDAVRDKVIFRIPQQRSVVFITDTFVDRVREHGLTGLELKELWSAGFSERKQKADGKTSLNDPQSTPINGRDFIEQFKERLKKLISEKTGFSKDRIELLGTIEVNIQYQQISAYFSVGNEEYLFSHNEPWDTGDLMKTVQSWHKEKSKGE